MTHKQAIAALDKIGADTRRALNDCRINGGSEEMVQAIRELSAALIAKVMALAPPPAAGGGE